VGNRGKETENLSGWEEIQLSELPIGEAIILLANRHPFGFKIRAGDFS
jgi:hypothetical protein